MKQDQFIIIQKKRSYGVASNDELKELKEEGIQTELIPWIEDKDN